MPAARGDRYDCFVREDTRIPFMAMPDGVDALVTLAAAPRDQLTRTEYNVAAFNPSAVEFRTRVLEAFPAAQIECGPPRVVRQELHVDAIMGQHRVNVPRRGTSARVCRCGGY